MLKYNSHWIQNLYARFLIYKHIYIYTRTLNLGNTNRFLPSKGKIKTRKVRIGMSIIDTRPVTLGSGWSRSATPRGASERPPNIGASRCPPGF